jgi:glutamyl-tRNA synthetase
VQWFDGGHLAKSPAQWDAAKLAWVNAQHLKRADDQRLAGLVQAELARQGIQAQDLTLLARACALFKDRCETVVELAQWASLLHRPAHPSPEDLDQHVGDALRAALPALRDALATCPWDKEGIQGALKAVLVAHKLKMAQLAPGIRVLVCGRAQTPSIDAVLALFDRTVVLQRLTPGG